MPKLLLKTLVSSSRILSVSVVRLPFASRGKQYRSGDLIESPDGIALYSTKVKDNKIVEVNEHNYKDLATYLEYRRDVKGARELLEGYLGINDKTHDPKYVEKVMKLANKADVDTEGKSIEVIVDEIKAKSKSKG